MHARNVIITIILVMGIVLLGYAPAHAQQALPITAEVDRTSVSRGETITLTVTIRSDSITSPSPDMPVLDGFDILGTSTSSSLSLINGQVESSSAYIFTLRPTRTGSLTIPPFGVKLKDRAYQTEPIQVEVIEGGPGGAQTPAAVPPQGSAPDGDLRNEAFAQAEVDNANPYVGQAVAYIFRFYHSSPLLGRSYYSAPAFTGFWTEKETTQTEYATQVNDAFYTVTELHTILFPTTAGDVTIDPARLTISGGFFEPDIELKGEAVTLHVKPVPEGAPAGFDGAVGKYTISKEVSAKQGKAGEPITYELTISGEGNLKNLPDPHWPAMEGWRVYESKGSVDTKIVADRVTGKRTYERLLVPQKPGEYEIPALSYIYFDPQNASYETISTQPVYVSIAAGEVEAPTLQASVPKSKTEVEQLSSDIRFLKSLPAGLGKGSLPLLSDWLYWLAWVFSLLVFLGNIAWEWYRIHRRENIGLLRSSQARRRAAKVLARSLRSSGVNAYAAAGEILSDYLADKTGQPVAGMTRPLLITTLEGRGIAPATVRHLQETLDAAEAGRYSPQTSIPGDGMALLQTLPALLDELEREFGK